MSQLDATLQFSRWLGGVNEQAGASELTPDELVSNQNWEYGDRGALVMREGCRRYTDAAGLPAPIQTIFRLTYNEDQQRQLLVTAGTQLFTVDTGGVNTALPLRTGEKAISSLVRSGTTATATSTAHGYSNGDAVSVYGATQPEYNGWWTIGNVTADTFDYTVASSAATPATGSLFAFKTSEGYYRPASAYTAGRTFSFAQRFSQVFLANGADPITMYNPLAPTPDLQRVASAYSPQAPVALNWFEERLFALNDVGTAAQRLAYSMRGDGSQWNGLDFLDIRSPGGGVGVALRTRNDHQILFFSDSILALYGSSKETFQRVWISETIGAVSSGGIVTLSDGTIEFVSQTGIYALSGMEVRLVSWKVSPRFESGITAVHAAYDSLGRRAIFSSVGGKCLVHSHRGPPKLDPETGRLEVGPFADRVYPQLPERFSVWDGPGDQGEVLFSTGNHLFQVVGHYDENAAGTVTSIEAQAVTGYFDPQDSARMNRARWIYATHDGADPLTVTLLRDFGVSSEVVTLPGTTSSGAVWGRFNWGAANWAGSAALPRRASLLSLVFAHLFAIKIGCSSQIGHSLSSLRVDFVTRDREVFA